MPQLLKSVKQAALLTLFFVIHIYSEPMGTDAAYFTEHLAPTIEQIMQNQDIPGLSIAVVHGNDVAYAQGFGLANKENNVPATPETVYGIGSVSKVFTATAVMQAVEDELVDLDAPVTRYLPRFTIKPPLNMPAGYSRSNLDPITPFNLMIHYSGMPKEPPVRAKDLLWIPQTLPELMQNLYNRSHLLYPPNFRYSYSNPGIAVLGRILEVISGENFEEYMQRILLQPLEMHTSSFSNTGFSKSINAQLAQGYATSDQPVNRPPVRGIPAGNLHSSVLDIANFMKMYLNKGVYKNQEFLKPETIEEMFTVQNTQLRKNDHLHKGPNQGLVWILNNKDLPGSPKTARHNGSVVGFSSVLILLPEEKLGVIVLTNIRNPNIKPAKIAKAALAVAREKYSSTHAD